MLTNIPHLARHMTIIDQQKTETVPGSVPLGKWSSSVVIRFYELVSWFSSVWVPVRFRDFQKAPAFLFAVREPSRSLLDRNMVGHVRFHDKMVKRQTKGSVFWGPLLTS